MKIKRAWAIQSLAVCFALNAVLAVLVFMMANRTVAGLEEWISPLLGPGGAGLPENAHSAVSGAGVLLAELHRYLAPALAALAGATTLLLWLFIFLLGRRQIDRAAKEAVKPGFPEADLTTEDTQIAEKTPVDKEDLPETRGAAD